MKIITMSGRQAIHYVPQVPTYFIRIFDSCDPDADPPKPLQQSDLFIEKRYTIDEPDIVKLAFYYPQKEIEETKKLCKLLQPGMAKEIILGLHKELPNIEQLALHCYMGAVRSPTMSLALADIFGWDYDHPRMTRYGTLFNWNIYETMLYAALDLKEENKLSL